MLDYHQSPFYTEDSVDRCYVFDGRRWIYRDYTQSTQEDEEEIPCVPIPPRPNFLDRIAVNYLLNRFKAQQPLV